MVHAYFITAFQNFEVLDKLISLLDYPDNIIFLHVDRKVENFNYDDYRKKLSLKYSELIGLPRFDMIWASHHEIECIVSSMEEALHYHWDYFHYITENDMPLKTQKQIHDFFELHAGYEFISFTPQWYRAANYKCQVYHMMIDNPKYRTRKAMHYIDHGLARLQYYLGVRRSGNKFYHGSGYYSLTRAFVQYVVGQKEDIRHDYARTLCGMEVFIQTLCWYSSFRERVYKFEAKYEGNLRYIDWDRREGNSPHTFTMDDWEEIEDKIRNSDLCFIRKIKDGMLAEKICEHLSGQ